MEEDGERVQLVTLYTRVLLHLAEHPRISQETLARRMPSTVVCTNGESLAWVNSNVLLLELRATPTLSTG